MSDWLFKLHRNVLTAPLARGIGLPDPVPLARSLEGYQSRPMESKNVFIYSAPEGFATGAIRQAVEAAGALPHSSLSNTEASPTDILVVDATGCVKTADYDALHECCHTMIRKITINGRVLLLAASPQQAVSPIAAAIARGIEGLVRSLGKELGPKGITVNLLYVEEDALSRLEGPVRFFCSAQSTYVTGQAAYVSANAKAPDTVPFYQALRGKVALITGAARGIGKATAERLSQEGARLVCLDVPAASTDLHDLCGRIGALPLLMDIALPDTPDRLAAFLRDRFGGVDILIHNAGITRDRTLAKMSAQLWQKVIEINLASVLSIDEKLLTENLIESDARMVCVSSIGGIAGNFGQTNYATSKAALIGYVAARAAKLARYGVTVNAIAPGFIETEMTAAMPFLPREVGRRLNSLKQGGQPRDVAELIAFLCTPGASGISGQTIRVCGQALLGA
ncbi:3-oxoacyl-[acyl-carrier protein] reductase [Duganella sp. CF402]|uniref:3-oxoacyl-ACP reductase n=1 Tax=unclassified Duganella TaxID=2636909 RepID=UPI0008CD7D75|nr:MULTISPECIES: 3-oxoacyl-ACP reductase [unclassified Duganella]RZT08190.1 3-oxoacyl-[acyl-carrier protein] reductase [Duganella sp. BK701]SEM02686.1 3-oxoacyl-[acyl-carrier protein] reductase [Duganella sp. CF402]